MPADDLNGGVAIVFRSIKSRTFRLVLVDGQPRVRGMVAGEDGVDLEKVVVNSSMISVRYAMLFGWSSRGNCPVVERVVP